MGKNTLCFIVLAGVLGVGVLVSPAFAEVHSITIDPSTHGGATGTISFDDWGYTGPAGRGWNDFAPVNGFGTNPLDPTGGVGQIQTVTTVTHDWVTPDAPQTIYGDRGSPNVYTNANLDTGVNFYQWGYTTQAGSQFRNMNIDYNGDYFVAQQDMNFNFYNFFDYKQETVPGSTPGTLADGRYPTKLAFQPYVLSNGTGWCGSVLTSHPDSYEAMAGQLTFDFAFDVYSQLKSGALSYMSTEIVRGFQMRAYGTITVDVDRDLVEPGVDQHFTASAVPNNVNPALGVTSVDTNTPTDPAFHDIVTFMGAGILDNAGECGVISADWQAGQRGVGVKKFSSLIGGVSSADACTAAGGSWQSHAFTGYAFILRADGQRDVTYYDEAVYGPAPSGSNVPVPASVLLIGSGLAGLLGVARRRQ